MEQTPRNWAITGAMGSGKSRVARLLARLTGLPLVDADAECARLLAPEGEGLAALRELLGHEFFDRRGRLDRPRLRAAIFANPGLRARVDACIHPLARQAVRKRLQAGPCLAEVPLLFEAGWQDDFTGIIAVHAPVCVCLARIQARDRVNAQQARAGLAAQLASADKALAAGHVIDNSGHWAWTELQARRLARMMQGADAEPSSGGTWAKALSQGIP